MEEALNIAYGDIDVIYTEPPGETAEIVLGNQEWVEKVQDVFFGKLLSNFFREEHNSYDETKIFFAAWMQNNGKAN